jgi:hypothetical protein
MSITRSVSRQQAAACGPVMTELINRISLLERAEKRLFQSQYPLISSKKRKSPEARGFWSAIMILRKIVRQADKALRAYWEKRRARSERARQLAAEKALAIANMIQAGRQIDIESDGKVIKLESGKRWILFRVTQGYL